MANAVPNTIVLVVDGKSVEVKNANPLNSQVGDALKDPKEFKAFAKDPAAFAKRFGLTIDPDVSALLSKSIGTAISLEELRSGGGNVRPSAVLWAVAVGVYSLAATKIAVAALEE